MGLSAEKGCHPKCVLYFYRKKRSFGQGNIFTPVCHSFCSQGGGGPDQARPPPTRYTPRARYTPQDQVHPPWDQVHSPPGTRYPPPRSSRLRNTVNDRPVRILLEYILVRSCNNILEEKSTRIFLNLFHHSFRFQRAK